MIPRTTMAQADAVIKPLTLIEKLENRLFNLRKRQRFEEDECLALQYKDNVDGFKWAVDIVKQHSQETCNWRNNKGTGLWECHYGGDYTSDCGLEWNMSNKDSPSENEMHFCPKCGKKLVEVQSPSEVKGD